MGSTDKSALVLTSNSADRIWGCIFGLMMTPFMTYIGYCLHEKWKPTDRTERVLQFLAVDCFFTFAVFLALGLVWTLFAPRWLTGLLQATYGKVKLAVGVFALGLVCSCAYLFWLR